MNKKQAIILLAIIVFGLLLRTIWTLSALQAEPDNAIYLNVMQQTMANHNTIPAVIQYAGFAPNTAAYTESAGLIYLGLLPYEALGGFLTQIQTMYLILAIFAILGILIVYKLTKHLTNNINMALLGAFLFATVPAAIFRGSLNEWRGDSFVPTLLAASLLLLYIFLIEPKAWKRYLTFIGSIILIVASWQLWVGGIYAIAVYAFAWLLLFTYTLSKRRIKFTVVAGFIFLAIFLFLLFGSNIPFFQNYGARLITIPNTLGATISELEPPSFLTFFILFLLDMPLMIWGIVAWVFSKKNSKENAIFLMMLATVLIVFPLALLQVRWAILLALPTCVLAAYGIQALTEYKDKFHFSETNIKKIIYLIVIVGVLITPLEIILNPPPQSVSHAYQQAMVWIDNNTTPNATFLTEWSDGSVIEGWAHRSSYTDSLTAQNVTKIANFSQFLYANAGNFSYLQRVAPDYLIARTYWIYENGSIKIEGGIQLNKSLNGTNFQFLLSNSTPNTITEENITLQRIYNTNGTIIYKVTR